jgi:hypothetical protein
MDPYEKFVKIAECYIRMFCGLVFIMIGFSGALAVVVGGAWVSMSNQPPTVIAMRPVVVICTVVVSGYALALAGAGILHVYFAARDVQTLKGLPHLR